MFNKNVDEACQIFKLSEDYIFRQDNDPEHCSKMTKLFFKKREMYILPWPAQSSDLSPIEHL